MRLRGTNRNFRRVSPRVPFNPRKLFRNSEQGVWYDPSDLSTLFQDSAGTTPVTAVEQPVGLMLDKSGRGNHAFQATAIDRPILRQDANGKFYLAANGTNTWMQTNSIDFTGTDKVTVFAGVRKLSDAASGMVAELSDGGAARTGVFSLIAPAIGGTVSYRFTSKGDGTQANAGTGVFAPAPDSAVLTCVGNISGDVARLSRNGVVIETGTVDQGFGNYTSHQLYLFRRAGTSVPFNGNFYGLLIRGALTSDPDILKMERWLALKTGVQL